ncbi:septum formation inhibitor Maf [uncultured Polaribacter sp.]|uniref:septum formation inhibitor Maf n=1 Tax=uncultured Polaribacter sp. TaxID=174711 RepID=UPI00263098AC|nr:septum formation inhibitor Maf [uncultured Polaribacter sp.]
MFKIYSSFIFSFLFLFCSNPEPKKAADLTSKKLKVAEKHPDFNAYWYVGKAEITSYKLDQVRYGQMYKGTAVNIFVTEDFLPKKQVKADYQNKNNVSVLKLNSTKKYTTGIYPYSIMTSTFSPIDINKQALKISFAAQEWCGNTFMQLNNREKFDINFFSYFESNADRKLMLAKEVLENELWNQLRINPESIQQGNYKIVPSFEFLALNHQQIKAHNAEVSLKTQDDFLIFSINYPNLKRRLSITLTKKFPHTIESWEETITQRGKEMTTKATKIKTIKSAYWSKNGVTDKAERKALGLN